MISFYANAISQSYKEKSKKPFLMFGDMILFIYFFQGQGLSLIHLFCTFIGYSLALLIGTKANPEVNKQKSLPLWSYILVKEEKQ